MSIQDRFNRMDGTSPVQNPINFPDPVVPRSRHNFSNIQVTQALIGALHPLQPIDMLPNDKVTINVNLMIMLRNPLVRRLLSGMRAYVHFWYCRKSDLWEGANNFFLKGNTGRIDLKIPRLRYMFDVEGGGKATTLTPLSPCDTMGYPVIAYNGNQLFSFHPTNVNENSKVGNEFGDVSALYPFMYDKICKENYFNKNLLLNNKKWYPENTEHFIIPYSADYVSDIDYDNIDWWSEHTFGANFGSVMDVDLYNVPENSDYENIVGSLHFRQWKGDDFTTASPFIDMLRGDVPTLDLASVVSTIDFSDVVVLDEGEIVNNIFVGTYNGKLTNGYRDENFNISSPLENRQALLQSLNKAKVNSILQSSINLSQLRQLEAFTLIKERNAMSDGSYNEMMKNHFGYNPHSYERQARYVGGMYQDIVFTEVLQTSESGSTPLGTKVGQGISAGSGYIGEFTSPDHGILMPILSIVPDVYYTQGVDRQFSKLTQPEQYLPLLNNLSAQAILNKEIYPTGNPDVDNSPFGYQERFSEFKSRRNIVTGLSRLNHEKSDYDASLILARRFYGDNPVLLNNYNTTCHPANTDMSIFSVPLEAPFDVTIATIVDRVSPVPSVTIPGGLSARGV